MENNNTSGDEEEDVAPTSSEAEINGTEQEILGEDYDQRVQLFVGMEFDSPEHLFQLFNNYAREVGFPVRKRSSKKGDDGVVNYIRYMCAREGYRKSKSSNSLKPRPVSGIGCEVSVSGKYTEWNRKRQIINLILDHNHDCSPSKSRLFTCNRKLTEKDKYELSMRAAAGVKTPASHRVSVEERGGYANIPFISKDCRNHNDKVRRLQLVNGDVVAIRDYFLRMQIQNKDFYYSMSLDEEGRLENIFWADGRSRLAYKEFGEVVTFDTTYLVNNHDMPFAPFVGVNHHGQSMLFGCGLVSHETTETFIWLFRTWLACMDGNAPSGIITDQDRAMQKAIGEVFPNTVHRWCLWHILKKVPEKLNGYTNHKEITKDLHNVVYDSQRPADFEESWSTMIEKYSLEDNMWLCHNSSESPNPIYYHFLGQMDPSMDSLFDPTRIG